MTVVRRATFAELDAATLYAILRLRAEVFVGEQECAYVDPDGRDTELGTVHCWIEEHGRVAAYLRVVDPPRIGRVVTAPDARNRGLAGLLLRDALEWCARPVELFAQSHLADWYTTFGFRVTGPDFDEDGIAHTPMRLG